MGIRNEYAENMNNFQQTNTPLTWEEIDKVKWTEYVEKNSLFDGIIETNQFQSSPHVNALEGIYKSNKEHFQKEDPFNPPLKHDNLYSLVMSKDLLRISYNKLKKNRGALTPGTANQTADSMSEKVIETIHIQLKTHTFKWNPTKRIEVQKPGTAPGVTRPLGLPDFNDKMVQNNIMIILTAIYEPEFQLINSNFGFRPKKSPNNAIKKIRIECNGMDIAIEGDVVGANDNVKHNILLNKLRLRIADEKFLELIHEALKAGFMKETTYYDTFLGTPQGGIHSPILFNIYMNEFDKFIKYEIPKIIKKWNKKNPNSSEVNANYANTARKARKLERLLPPLNQSTNPLEILKKSKQLNTANMYEDIYNSIKHQIPNHEKKLPFVEKYIYTLNNQPTLKEEQYAIKKLKEMIKLVVEKYKLQEIARTVIKNQMNSKYKKEKSLQLKMKAKDPNKKIIAYRYYRYADDWILFLRSTEKTGKTVKKILENWLRKNLGLELSPEKTLITNIRKNKAHFLGFEIFHAINRQVTKKIWKDKTALQRYGRIQIMPDVEKLYKKFQIKNYLRKDNRILSLGSLTPLEDHQIIEKYNQFMIGFGLYYITEISRPGALNYWHYVMYYSCLKTLSHKHRSSVKKIINKYGYLDLSKPHNKKRELKKRAYDQRVIASYKKNDETIKYHTLLNYNEFMMNLIPIRDKYRNFQINSTFNSPTIDFLRLHKNNWRTKFKLSSMCTICGSTEKIEMHHIKHLKNSNTKQKTYKGFDQLVAALGRKQICVCRKCHEKIHKGEYNKTSLRDLVDIRLVAPESLLKGPQPITIQNTSQTKKEKNKIEIDEINKTYFNKRLHIYYQSKNKYKNFSNKKKTDMNAISSV